MVRIFIHDWTLKPFMSGGSMSLLGSGIIMQMTKCMLMLIANESFEPPANEEHSRTPQGAMTGRLNVAFW